MDAVQSFDSWLKFVRHAKDAPSDFVGLRESREINVGGFWYGTKTFEEAIWLAENGWIEGSKRIKSELQAFYDKIPSKRRRLEMEMSMVGPGTLDMGRYIMGHPEPWTTWQEREVDDTSNGKVIRVVCNIGGLASVSVSEMFKKGVVVCALIDLLERSNRRVELLMANKSVGRRGDSLTTKVLVKEANAPLDLERVAFALAHAACFRRLVFSIRETFDKGQRELCGVVTGGGYGSTVTYRETDCVCIGNDNALMRDDNRRNAWLRQVLEEQGIEWGE